MHFRYLLWDFDGTLFDTYTPLIRSIMRALADVGISESREFIAGLLNQTFDICMATLTQKHALDRAALEAHIAHYQNQLTPEDKPPFPGVIPLCKRHIAAGGQHYLFTHRDRTSLMSLLDWYKVTDLFTGIMTCDDGYPRKPDPAGFNALIETYHLPRPDILAVGDRALDIQAGQAAGVKTCLYNTQPSPNAPPDYVITAFDELASILGL